MGWTSLRVLGSSPRVWGQVYTKTFNCLVQGIIPTRVGTSSKYPFLSSLKQDHPHACGDKYRKIKVKKGKSGSSPRVWGQVFVCKPSDLDNRIIPTRVGTRTRKERLQKMAEDHPHACGDKTICLSGR